MALYMIVMLSKEEGTHITANKHTFTKIIYTNSYKFDWRTNTFLM